MTFKNNAGYIFLILFLSAFCFSLARQLINVKYIYYGDLRNRVVGARLMAENRSPYYFKWNPSQPETLYDPADKCNIKNNMITSPPSVLLLMEPLAWMNYGQICYVWVVLHYLFFLLMLAPLYLMVKDSVAGNFVLVAAILLLLSDYWNDSVFRGQSHFIFPAIIANILFITSRRRQYRFVYAGLLFALLIWVRPNALLIVPFLYFGKEVKRFQFVGGVLAGSLFFVVVTIVFHQANYWIDFYNSCREWVKNNSSGVSYVNCSWPGVSAEKQLLPHIPFYWKSQIGDIETLTSSLLHVKIASFYLFATFFVAYIFALYTSVKRPALYFPEALLLGILLYWLAETTSPILKMSYYYVELFPVVLFFAARFTQLFIVDKCLLLAAFLFAFASFIPMNLVIGEWCLIGCMGSYLFHKKFGLKKMFSNTN